MYVNNVIGCSYEHVYLPVLKTSGCFVFRQCNVNTTSMVDQYGQYVFGMVMKSDV